MSKKINVDVVCSSCGLKFQQTIYRSIWGEHESNRNLVMHDQINVGICPSCGMKGKLLESLLYTDSSKKFAVWWEPQHDQQIDIDSKEYAKLFGDGNYYHTAPRIKDWEEFKNTIIKFESGVLCANPIRISEADKELYRGMLADFIKKLKLGNARNQLALIMFVCLIFIIILIYAFTR